MTADPTTLLDDLRALASTLQLEGRDFDAGTANRAVDELRYAAAKQQADLVAMTDDEFAEAARNRGWSVGRDRRCGERYDPDQNRARLAYTNWTYVATSPRKYDNPIEWVK